MNRQQLVINGMAWCVVRVACCVLGGALCASAQSYSVDWYKVSGGGATSTGSVFSISGTVGQPDASGAMNGGVFSVTGGFWSLIAAVQTAGAPLLEIARPGPTGVMVSWPAPSTGWVLQENSSLTKGQWLTVVSPLTQAGERLQSLQPLAWGARFYRLSQVAGAPGMSVQTTANNTVVSWTTLDPSWILESCPASGVGGWTRVGATPTEVGGQMEVTLPLAAATNFYQLVQAPTLTTAHSGTNTVIIAWPDWVSGWALQQSATLASNSWVAVTNSPAQAGTNTQVTVSLPPGRMFYRLEQQ